MGRKRKDSGDIENKAPHHRQANQTDKSLVTGYKMKTRSGKAQILTESNSSPEVSAPTTSLGTPSTSPKRALAKSSCNDQTPERSAPEPISRLRADSSGNQAQATPTSNLKILCQAVDHDESISAETSEIVRSKTDPVTPTANLKMLITAASPEIRSLELSKSRLFTDEDDEDADEDASSKKVSKTSSTRKQKSLGVLCRRFMAQFEESPPPTSRIEVCLDELASHLGTERRRIYDIVNVLESVEMMSRRAKNRYLWHGKTNLNATLVKLKYFAETEKVSKQLELVRELEIARLYGRKSKSNGFMQTESEAVLDHPKYKEYMELFGDAHKKERSLGVMSQKFLMLFLTSKTKTINLDMAAKILLGDPMVETKQTNSQFKTKIRRLYDIANILASIQLICKVHVTEVRGRKPAFSYIGPDVEQLATLDEYKYLKDVEVARPGRTTLDMKMEELKKKMEAHLAGELEGSTMRQVPPVTVQAPDLEEIKQNMASSSGTSLLQAATEHAAAKKDRVIKPKSQRSYVVIQGVAGGTSGSSVVTTATAPMFMDLSQHTVSSSTGSQEPRPGISLLPVAQTAEGNPLYLAAQPITQSPVLHSTPPPTSSRGTRHILPQISTKQTLTLYTPPQQTSSLDDSSSSQQKRTSSQALDTVSTLPSGTTSALVQGPDGTISTFFVSKADNEYFLIHKKPRLESEQEVVGSVSCVDTSRDTEPTVGAEETVTSLDGVEEVCATPVPSHSSSAPLPLVYSTPSTQHPPEAAVGDSALVARSNSDLKGTEISFLASPIVTPVEERVSKNVEGRDTRTARQITIRYPL